jgi:serine phosphatase RsbU (regulator of sigma subunit)
LGRLTALTRIALSTPVAFVAPADASSPWSPNLTRGLAGASTVRSDALLQVAHEIPGVQVAARSLPAADGRGALGDFYDMFPVRLSADTDARPHADRVQARCAPTGEGERWDAVIGDVSGHGPQAAMVAALARHTIRAVATAEKTPSQILDRLNTALLTQDPGSERFLTATHLTLFPRPGAVRVLLASAGHMPTLLRSSAGPVRPIGNHGLPLGLFANAGLTNTRVTLRPGDTMLLYTDGVTEARQGREQYGEQRLRALLSATGQLGAQDLVDAVEEDVLTFTGGFHTDDIAILALHATGPAEQIP